MQKTQGFTLIEMLISVGLVSIMAMMYMVSEHSEYNNLEAKNLAISTQAYAKAYSKFLSDVHDKKLYVMTGNSDECVPYNPFGSQNTATFSLADLRQKFGKKYVDPTRPNKSVCRQISGDYAGSFLKDKNKFNQSPCLGVTFNQSLGKYEALLFYVDSGSRTPDLSLARLAAINLNGKGGYFSNNQIISKGGWTVNANDIRLADPQHCGGSRIAPNSLLINMDEFMEFNDDASNSAALSRESDEIHPVGSKLNTNTSKSDLFMSHNGTPHKIIFDKTNNVVMSTSGSTISISGAFQASSLQGTLQVASGSPCDVSQVGAMAKQNDPEAQTIGIQQGEAICTDSELICAVYGTRYCWIPAKGNTVHYGDPNHTGRLTDKLICPAFAPFMEQATGYQVGTSLPVTFKNLTTSFVNPNTGKTYAVVRSVQAIGDSTTSCAVWQYSVAYGCTLWNTAICQAGSSYHYDGACGNTGGTAICDGFNKDIRSDWVHGNHTITGGAGKDWKCIQQTTPPPTYLDSVTCTSKLVVQGS